MKSKVKALGEIALRVQDLREMSDFYEQVVGLEVMRKSENMAFFRIAEGHGGHTQILALFDRRSEPGYKGVDGEKTTVDHFAFAIDLEDFEFEKDRLQHLGLCVETTVHAWVKWRSLYFNDPEGNRVEFVCFDESVN